MDHVDGTVSYVTQLTELYSRFKPREEAWLTLRGDSPDGGVDQTVARPMLADVDVDLIAQCRRFVVGCFRCIIDDRWG